MSRHVLSGVHFDMMDLHAKSPPPTRLGFVLVPKPASFSQLTFGGTKCICAPPPAAAIPQVIKNSNTVTAVSICVLLFYGLWEKTTTVNLF